MDANLVAQLLAVAVRMTGLPAIPEAELPQILSMTKEAITQEMCPERPSQCDTLVALFEPVKYRVIYRDTLNLRRTFDRSFLLHELVHVLQFKAKGRGIFETCQSRMQAEREAYFTQDRFLAEHAIEIRVGGALRFMNCPPEAAKSDPGGQTEALGASGGVGPAKPEHHSK
jgi:hypothetical protein